MKDYYNILGVIPSASKAEIKEAYRKWSKKFHPDSNEGDAFFEDRMKEVNEAYKILSDDLLREDYDEERLKEAKKTGTTAQQAPKNKVKNKKLGDGYLFKWYYFLIPLFFLLFAYSYLSRDSGGFAAESGNYAPSAKKPYKLLQSYYNLFESPRSVNAKVEHFYAKELLVFHQKRHLPASTAKQLDLEDFEINEIKSYKIKVIGAQMFVDQYPEMDIVSVPLEYTITSNSGKISNPEIRIMVALNKKSTKILAIGKQLDYRTLKEML